MKLYYYADGRRKVGPLSLQQLMHIHITADTLVWYEGLSSWVKASEVNELQSLFVNTSNTSQPTSTSTPPNLDASSSIPWMKYVAIAIVSLFLVWGYLLLSRPSGTNTATIPIQKQSTTNNPTTIPAKGTLVREEERLAIDAKKIALRKFDLYSPKIESSHGASIGNAEAFTGDLNMDGLEDAIVYFVLNPKEGGNANLGQGMAVYLNNGRDMEVVTGFEPEYIFRVDGIENNKIHIVELQYAEGDNLSWPSIEKHKYLILKGSKLQESNTF